MKLAFFLLLVVGCAAPIAEGADGGPADESPDATADATKATDASIDVKPNHDANAAEGGSSDDAGDGASGDDASDDASDSGFTNACSGITCPVGQKCCAIPTAKNYGKCLSLVTPCF